MTSYAVANPADAFTYGVHFGMAFILVLVVVALVVTVGLKKPVPREAALAVAPSSESSAVAGIMKPDVYTISRHATLIGALRYIVAKGISGAPVVDDAGKPVGFISDSDILHYLSNADPLFAGPYSFIEVLENGEGFKGKLDDLVNLTVEDAATKTLVTIEEDNPLDTISRILHDRHLKKVPVTKQGVMVGMLNRCDLMRYALDMFDGTVAPADAASDGSR